MDRKWRRAARNRSSGGAKMYGSQRAALCAGLTGTVLEIGPGAGVNLARLPAGVNWIGLEPNPYLHRDLEAAARGRGVVLGGLAERIPLADASVDAVLGTIVLCSVTDQRQVLAEIVRVLRPGGRYLFLEHVGAPPGTRLRRVQRAITPLTRWFDAGCEQARDTVAAIETAGFARVELERFDIHGPFGVRIPHVTGSAVVSP